MTSLGGISWADTRQKGAAAFTTTHWSVVLEAQGESPVAQEALEKLCRIYWRPIYSFVQRQGVGSEEAKDLTQGFFALLLERRNLNAVRQEKGRLRSYLLASLKYFLAGQQRRFHQLEGVRHVILSEVKLQRSGPSPRGRAFNLRSSDFCSALTDSQRRLKAWPHASHFVAALRST